MDEATTVKPSDVDEATTGKPSDVDEATTVKLSKTDLDKTTSQVETNEDVTAITTQVSEQPLEKRKILPEWYQDVLHRKQQNIMKEQEITTQTQLPVTPNGPKGLPPLVNILRQSQPADISHEKKAWFKKPVDAKAAEFVFTWFAMLIAGLIGVIIAMDVNVYRKQGRRAFNIMRRWIGRRKIKNEEEIEADGQEEHRVISLEMLVIVEVEVTEDGEEEVDQVTEEEWV